MDLAGRQLLQQFGLAGRRNLEGNPQEVADRPPHLNIHADGPIFGHSDQAVAAGMGQIELKILGRSGEEGLSEGSRVKLQVSGIASQLEGKYASNCTMCLQ
jgi:hypothetical protein